MRRRDFLAGSAACLVPAAGRATEPATGAPRQVASETYAFTNTAPAWAEGTGPQVRLHRAVSPYVQRGAMVPFGNLVGTDGFRFAFLDETLSESLLADTAVLCIANAYSPEYDRYGVLDSPQVYSEAEVAMIREWVEGGGSVLLLADHAPFCVGTISLAEAFGFSYLPGHAVRKDSLAEYLHVNIDFRRSGEGLPNVARGMLVDHPILDGAMGRARISHFYAFGGQAIIPAPGAANLLVIPDNFEAVLTYAIERDFYTAPRIDAAGLSQGSLLELGKGRVAIFGETGGFTSQRIDGGEPFGLESPRAGENAEFVLSLMRWLARYEG